MKRSFKSEKHIAILKKIDNRRKGTITILLHQNSFTAARKSKVSNKYLYSRAGYLVFL